MPAMDESLEQIGTVCADLWCVECPVIPQVECVYCIPVFHKPIVHLHERTHIIILIGMAINNATIAITHIKQITAPI